MLTGKVISLIPVTLVVLKKPPCRQSFNRSACPPVFPVRLLENFARASLFSGRSSQAENSRTSPFFPLAQSSRNTTQSCCPEEEPGLVRKARALRA